MNDMPKRIPLTPAEAPHSGPIARRTVIQALLGGMGAGLALPGVAAAQHPVVHHLERAREVQQGQTNAHAGAYEPLFLDAHQLRTLEALAETIVPGSTDAKVAPFVDGLLAVESQQNQRDFLGALGAFDMAAIHRHGKAWIGITADEQRAILAEGSATDAAKTPFGRHFQNLKTWIAGVYYTSEPGMRELGWTGSVFHPELPGCTHPDGHA
jgi:hypothetical protein